MCIEGSGCYWALWKILNWTLTVIGWTVGCKKISKFVINGSILIIEYAVERLDKNKHF